LCGGIGVHDLPEDVQPLVYPNPTNGNINIQLEPSHTLALEIVDAIGRVVWGLSNPHDKTTKIDISSWPSGSYFLKITSTHMPVQITKLTLIN
jgi:Secretion system C-terminal sorting domain